MISSPHNGTVKWVAKLAADKNFRRQERAFLCEGFVMLKEALAADMEVVQIFCQEGMEHKLPPHLPNCLTVVPETVIKKMCDTETPQGLAFVLRQPGLPELSGECVVALEDIRDPGNLGTILRTAEGLGIDQVALLGSCADIYAPKTVRASMGSVFRMPVAVSTPEQLRKWLDGRGKRLLGAALTADARPVQQEDLRNACIAVGNEAHGLSENTLKMCHGRVLIPMSGAQSLNAAQAAAILMWEMKRAER